MKTLNIIVIVFATCFLLACTREYPIESRAKSQLSISLAEELKIDVNSIETHNLKRIYANDSICLYQANIIIKDSKGEAYSTDIRYIYYIDVVESNIRRVPVFYEVIKEIPCMPDDLIKQSLKEVKKNKENVYSQFQGEGYSIKKHFDQQ